ncbi:hypothetical protein MIMGU_mgv1a024470mg [Erythranthe guttata]|uniref:VQ domain-containing protein n=1 Tax=Erythranthe guttata TaxID=4155 RepID=A0A022PXT0_ERYGU|nr:hypothetical protein MIMGU_mgv1a024470mg [Erythranthe guttata]
MDSGNSGSMQSSSGGDEQDFDSRAGSESISSFFNPSSHFRSTISAAAPHPPPPPYLPHHQIQNPTFFDHYMNTNDNHDLIWSRPGLIRSEHHDNYYAPHFGNTSSSSSLPIPTSTAAAEGHAGRAPPQASVPKNPKKRTRASRRAPTTVLTTDTTNFRQMVQEFTGIPAAPFSGGSPYPRRMDLFSAASSLRSGGHLGPLLRPSSSTTPPPPPSFLNSSMVDSTNANNPMSTTTNAAAPLGASTSNNQNMSFVLSRRDHLLNLQPSMDFGVVKRCDNSFNNSNRVALILMNIWYL